MPTLVDALRARDHQLGFTKAEEKVRVRGITVHLVRRNLY